MNKLYYKLKPAIVAIESENNDGDKGIGTGFHVGDGYVITARHVIEDRKNIKIYSKVAEKGEILEIKYAENILADIALLKTDLDYSFYLDKTNIQGMQYRKTDHLELGVEWDDFADDSLVLYDAIVLGYPPVPTAFPTLIAIRAQINAIIDQYPVGGGYRPPSYILSGIPRGGFSGAPVIIDAGDNSFVMGVITSALINNHNPIETGFMAAVTIESVLQILHENGVYPGNNKFAVKAYASELTDEEYEELNSRNRASE